MPVRLLSVLAAAGALGCLSLVALGQELASTSRHFVGHTDPVYTVDFTPDGALVVTGSFDKTVKAWDANCPKHIPQRFEATDVAAALAARDARIEALEREVQRLRAR